MKKILFIFLSFFNLTAVTFSTIDNLQVDASGAILMEKETKRVLYSKNIDERFLTASIVKVLTAIVVLENNSDLDKYVVVDDETVKQSGSSIYLKKDDRIKIIDLLYGMLLRSGNDAAYLLAKSTASTEKDFVKLMNDTAKKIKMGKSTFSNPSGLDEKSYNYSTCYDMALLMAYALDNKTFAKITETKKYVSKTYNGELLCFYNKHKLVTSLDYVTGGKTGYTKNAKRTLITSAKKDGMELIAVTFNCGDDWNVHKKLFDFGYNNYEMKTILKKQIIDLDNQYYHITPYLPVDINYPIKKGEKISCVVYLLKNPKEIKIGKIIVYLDNSIVISSPIYRYY